MRRHEILEKRNKKFKITMEDGEAYTLEAPNEEAAAKKHSQTVGGKGSKIKSVEEQNEKKNARVGNYEIKIITSNRKKDGVELFDWELWEDGSKQYWSLSPFATRESAMKDAEKEARRLS